MSTKLPGSVENSLIEHLHSFDISNPSSHDQYITQRNIDQDVEGELLVYPLDHVLTYVPRKGGC